jgi:hypothetical protein
MAKLQRTHSGDKLKMKKIALVVLALAFMASVSIAKDKAPKPPKAQKVAGYVTDAKCAKAGKAGEDHAACAKKCIEGGEAAVLVTDKDHKTLAIDNADAIKGHEGHHVTVTGVVTGDSIHVEKVAMGKAPKAPKPDKKG